MAAIRVSRLVEGSKVAPAPLALGMLTWVDDDGFDSLPSTGVLDALHGWERLIGVAAVEQARAVRAFAARIIAERGPERGTLLLDEEITEELALALRVSSAAAGAMVRFADGLGILGSTGDALASGSLGLSHARVLVDVLTSDDPLLDDAVRGRLEGLLVHYATTSPVTAGQLRRRAQRLLLTMDPDGAAGRREKACRRRYVSCRPDEHGMAWLSAYLPAQDARACYETLDRHARATIGAEPDDDRGLGARRADALVDRLLTGRLDGNAPETGRAARDVRIDVTVPITVLAGESDAPGLLDGHGPIDAHLARELAFAEDATWRRLLTEPMSGTVLDVGTTRYRPPAGLDRYVRLRDQTCRWPGCTVPAQQCDLDHTVAYPDGPTSEDNLVALCRRHHRLKTFAGFTTEQQGDGRWQVSTPTGRVIATGPPDLGPEEAPAA
jgi:hypothetical protein